MFYRKQQFCPRRRKLFRHDRIVIYLLFIQHTAASYITGNCLRKSLGLHQWLGDTILVKYRNNQENQSAVTWQYHLYNIMGAWLQINLWNDWPISRCLPNGNWYSERKIKPRKIRTSENQWLNMTLNSIMFLKMVNHFVLANKIFKKMIAIRKQHLFSTIHSRNLAWIIYIQCTQINRTFTYDVTFAQRQSSLRLLMTSHARNVSWNVYIRQSSRTFIYNVACAQRLVIN